MEAGYAVNWMQENCHCCRVQNMNKNGDITTLGRGGSDHRSCPCSSASGGFCEIYTDVDGCTLQIPELFPMPES